MGPTLLHLVTNDRGDVVELLDSAGSAFATYRYDAWGNPLPLGTQSRATGAIQSGELAALLAKRQVLRYAAYAYDSHSRLYYCSQRYYDPATFSFLSKDSLRSDGEESAYQYCIGDPIGNTDPSGEAIVLALPALGLLVLGVVVAAYLMTPVGKANLAYIIDEFGKSVAKAWVKALATGATVSLFEKNVNGWTVRGETHGKGKPHAHWKKNGKKGSVNKDGTSHHKGESSTPPREVRDFLKNKGFKV